MSHTVTLHDGVRERIDACIAHLAVEAKKQESAQDYAELASARDTFTQVSESFLVNLVRILKSTEHDGDVDLFTDNHSPLSFGFRYASGYHGGLNYFTSSNRWSVNT